MITAADVSLDGKTAIVTGGARGIGRAIALGLASFGAEVAVCDRDEENRAHAPMIQRQSESTASSPWISQSAPIQLSTVSTICIQPLSTAVRRLRPSQPERQGGNQGRLDHRGSEAGTGRQAG